MLAAAAEGGSGTRAVLTAPAQPAGTLLKGKYLVTEVLEENDRFVVARGLRLELDEATGARKPAGDILVRILKNAANRPGALERYTRELQVTSMLANHPLVIRYHDVDLIGNRYCVITDHLASPSLERLLLARQRLPYPAVLTVLKGLVTLLAAAGEHGMAERQIHLEDLLVEPTTGEIKLVKFSTPRSLTVKGTMTGRHGAAAIIGDLVFLGCTLFRLLALEHAFSGSQVSEIVAEARLVDALKAHQGELSGDEVAKLARLFARLVGRDVSQAFAALGEVTAALEELEGLNAGIVKARSRADTFKRRARKTRLLQTAFDTVAAFRGDLQAPRDDAPREELDPAMRGAATLLWGRHRDTESAMPLDDPTVVRGLMFGGVGLFMLMLFWLLFTH